MVKLIALYRKPADAAAFDEHYDKTHTPLVLQMPGLRKLEITRITGAPIGESKYYLVAEMYFDSVDAMNAANASPQGRATAKDLMNFAADLVTLFYGEVTTK
ncbi:MAG: EthD family reductase [Ignavibacteriales bacterium]|nr:EthD family reductase [Ignavibacteriales bacterium]